MGNKNLMIVLALCLGCGPSCTRPESMDSPSLQGPASQGPASQGPASQGPTAQGPSAQDRQACGADVEKLCASFLPKPGSTPKPGDQTVLNCLVAHKSELSEACRKNVESHTSRPDAAR